MFLAYLNASYRNPGFINSARFNTEQSTPNVNRISTGLNSHDFSIEYKQSHKNNTTSNSFLVYNNPENVAYTLSSPKPEDAELQSYNSTFRFRFEEEKEIEMEDVPVTTRNNSSLPNLDISRIAHVLRVEEAPPRLQTLIALEELPQIINTVQNNENETTYSGKSSEEGPSEYDEYESEGEEENESVDNDGIPEDLIIVETRYCTVCNIEQPIRAKHCKDCGRCIALHDHHCPWLGICVGERNRFQFYWYLVVQCAELWWGTVWVRYS